MSLRVQAPFLRFACACGVLSLATLFSSLATAHAARSAASYAAAGGGPPDAASGIRIRLISQEQYFNSLAYIFGSDITAAAHFAPFRRTDGLLESGAAFAGVTSGQMQEFQRTARAIAQQVVNTNEHRQFLIPCKPRNAAAADDACASKFLTAAGRLLYRRPLSGHVRDRSVAEAGRSANLLKDFYAGLGMSLEAMLIAPEVVFIADRSEPNPSRPAQVRLDSYSLASRLSFFLWNAGPDDELLKAAERGDLQTADGKAKQVDRMLNSPRLETGMRAFFDDMLDFDEFAVLSKDPGIYPAVVAETLLNAREQTLRMLIDHLLTDRKDYRDLFTTRDIQLTPALATLYGVPAPPGWTAYQIPADVPRAGLLTQTAFLVSHAHPGRSSPTLRGKALRELLLCQQVPRPPPNVDFSKIEDPKSPLLTARERLAAHRENPVCAGCHKIMDPIGLALENFDGAGQYRTTERGAPIDASGNLDGKQFTDAVGLGQALHDSAALPACLVKRVYTYGVGGSVNAADKSVLPYLGERFAAAGYKLPDLLRAVALSAAFSQVVPPATNSPLAQTASTAQSNQP